MTNMEKLQEALGCLFDDSTIVDDILEQIANDPTTFCSICKHSDECDRAFNAIESGWSCEGILKKHLEEEV